MLPYQKTFQRNVHFAASVMCLSPVGLLVHIRNENHFVKIANALSSENPVISGELCTALLFKPTAN
jgi:hypothetical protein